MSYFTNTSDLGMSDYLQFLDPSLNRLLSLNEQGNSQQQWEQSVTAKKDGGKMKPSEFAQATGFHFIDAGIGTGDRPMKDTMGQITGYSSRHSRSGGGLTPGLDRFHQMQSDKAAGKSLSTASGTPGLDAFHEMNPEQYGPSNAELVGPVRNWLAAPPVQNGPTLRKPAMPAAGLAQKSADMMSKITPQTNG